MSRKHMYVADIVSASKFWALASVTVFAAACRFLSDHHASLRTRAGVIGRRLLDAAQRHPLPLGSR